MMRNGNTASTGRGWRAIGRRCNSVLLAVVLCCMAVLAAGDWERRVEDGIALVRLPLSLYLFSVCLFVCVCLSVCLSVSLFLAIVRLPLLSRIAIARCLPFLFVFIAVQHRRLVITLPAQAMLDLSTAETRT